MLCLHEDFHWISYKSCPGAMYGNNHPGGAAQEHPAREDKQIYTTTAPPLNDINVFRAVVQVLLKCYQMPATCRYLSLHFQGQEGCCHSLTNQSIAPAHAEAQKMVQHKKASLLPAQQKHSSTFSGYAYDSISDPATGDPDRSMDQLMWPQSWPVVHCN